MASFDLNEISVETLRALEALTYMDFEVAGSDTKKRDNYLTVKRELYQRGLHPKIKPAWAQRQDEEERAAYVKPNPEVNPWDEMRARISKRFTVLVSNSDCYEIAAGYNELLWVENMMDEMGNEPSNQKPGVPEVHKEMLAFVQDLADQTLDPETGEPGFEGLCHDCEDGRCLPDNPRCHAMAARKLLNDFSEVA